MALICQCGCGETIPPRPYHSHYQPKYIQSHFLHVSKEARLEKARQTKALYRLSPPADWSVPSGLCECGCGKPTKIAKMTRVDRDQYIGYFMRYAQGHSANGCGKGALHNTWKGGRYQHRSGYVYLYQPEHPSANQLGYILEHRYIYEQTRKVALPSNIHIHHINGVRNDNRPENLIAFTIGDHKKAHLRASEVISLFVDDRLLNAARVHVRTHGELPDLEQLTIQVYQAPDS